MAPAPAFASFKIIEAFRNETYHRVLETPCQSRPTEIHEVDHCIICFTLSGNTIVTGTCWIRPARPLSTITLVAHPGGENHELANSKPNHELAITCICTTAPGAVTSTRILVGS